MNNERCRVLIVDDELLIRQGIKHYLHWEQEGFEIVGEAANGKEALSLIESVKPHIVVTDIVMPIMDGEELARIIRSEHPEIQVIILSSFGEFDYVRSTFQQGVTDYILKPKLEGTVLLKALQNAAERIPFFQLSRQHEEKELSASSLVRSWMAGDTPDLTEDTLRHVFPYPAFLIVNAYTRRRTGKSTGAGDMLERAGIKEWPDSLFVPLLSDQYGEGYLINTSFGREASWHECIRQLSQHPNGLVWSVSELFQNPVHLKPLYEQQAAALKRYSFYFPDQSFFQAGSLPNAEQESQPFQLAAFTDMLKRSQIEEAVESLLLHVNGLAQNHDNEVPEFKRFLSNIIFNVTLLLGDLGYENAKFNKEKYAYFAAIEEAASADEAIRKLTEFAADVKETVSEQTAKAADSGIKKIMEYIDHHYDQPLTLTEVAGHFHFNPSYFSTYFSTHSGESFNEYVTKIRIEKAVDLLGQHHISISEISEKVGYGDHSYFCKVFKKLKGMSPSSYRKHFFT